MQPVWANCCPAHWSSFSRTHTHTHTLATPTFVFDDYTHFDNSHFHLQRQLHTLAPPYHCQRQLHILVTPAFAFRGSDIGNAHLRCQQQVFGNVHLQLRRQLHTLATPTVVVFDNSYRHFGNAPLHFRRQLHTSATPTSLSTTVTHLATPTFVFDSS